MKNDPRINAKVMTLRNYALLFLFFLFLCGCYIGVYIMMIERTDDAIYASMAMFGYLICASLAGCGLFAWFRRRVLMRPVRRLSQAAQKVAAGDFSVRLSPMRKDGKKDELEVLFEDFNTMAEELGSTEVLKKDFISNVSHEMKTPLAVIQNYATILQSEELTEEERRDYSRRISESAGRLSVLVTNILQLNRLENQKIRPVPIPFNLSEALSRCILDFDARLEEKDIDLEVSLDQNLLLASDETLLDLVWNNLLSNAVKFTPAGGRVKISLRQERECAVVTVADSGCGMNAETLRHIFDKFYQADSSHATQGNGLGLALAKRVADLLGGSITVESVPETGTVFTVRIPETVQHT